MVDKEPPPKLCPGMNLNACEPTAKMRDEAGGSIPSPLIEEMSQTMEPNGMETRITEKNLHAIFNSGISLSNGSDIFLQTFPH
jgi:hypothetical protein